VRHFFRAGGASGTIAKAMSAYDKDYSDAIYGKKNIIDMLIRIDLGKCFVMKLNLLKKDW
jgi:hypothetical protein